MKRVGSFSGINIGFSGLTASQRNLQATGHNISNANTVGYSRQRVIQQSVKPESLSDTMQVGKGVDAAGIFQIRDSFLDDRFRDENTKLGYWSTKQQTTEELEAIFNEISDSGLQHVMDEFWNAWQEVAKDPQSLTARGILKEQAISFCETVDHLDHQLSKMQLNINIEIEKNVQQVNELSDNIARLNKEILNHVAMGEQPNDFLDQRNQLMDELSQIVPLQITESQNGMISLFLQGRTLVDGFTSNHIKTAVDMSNNGMLEVQWADHGEPLDLTTANNKGELNALITSRDSWIDQKRQDLNQLVSYVATEVNKQHLMGQGLDDASNMAFFSLSDGRPITEGAPMDELCSWISINPALDNLDNIAAASGAGGAGNNKNALAISQLRYKSFDVDGKSVTLDNYYRSIISDLGLEGQEAKTMADNQVVLCQEINNQRQSISGTSLDEEMTNMIKFQHSYNAAARVVNAMDEMIDRIINQTGVVGR